MSSHIKLAQLPTSTKPMTPTTRPQPTPTDMDFPELSLPQSFTDPANSSLVPGPRSLTNNTFMPTSTVNQFTTGGQQVAQGQSPTAFSLLAARSITNSSAFTPSSRMTTQLAQQQYNPSYNGVFQQQQTPQPIQQAQTYTSYDAIMDDLDDDDMMSEEGEDDGNLPFAYEL